MLEHPPSPRVHATLDKVKTSGIKRLIFILTGAAIVALSRSFVRFPVTALGVSSTILKGCSLLLLESSLSYRQDERHLESDEPNGLLQKPSKGVRELMEDDVRTTRDVAGVVTVVLFLLCISFENMRSYDMVYRPQEGPVDSRTAQLPPVKTIYYNWDVAADFLGVSFESLKAFSMLFMVSFELHIPMLKQEAALTRRDKTTRILHRKKTWCSILRILSLSCLPFL